MDDPGTGPGVVNGSRAAMVRRIAGMLLGGGTQVDVRWNQRRGIEMQLQGTVEPRGGLGVSELDQAVIELKRTWMGCRVWMGRRDEPRIEHHVTVAVPVKAVREPCDRRQGR
jgi:hypothetical protein